MNRILTFALALLLALPPLGASAQERLADTPPNTLDIMNNKGGNVVEAISRRARLEQYPGQIRIRGYCRSACTIYITMRNACLGAKARVGFHAPRIPNTNIIPPIVDELMGDYYRNGIRERWFGGWNRSSKMQVITAQEYVRLDPQTRICGAPRR